VYLDLIKLVRWESEILSGGVNAKSVSIVIFTSFGYYMLQPNYTTKLRSALPPTLAYKKYSYS